jgi:hypothetical protein
MITQQPTEIAEGDEEIIRQPDEVEWIEGADVSESKDGFNEEDPIRGRPNSCNGI